MIVVLAGTAALGLTVAGLLLWRLSDRAAETTAAARLLQGALPGHRFDPALIDALPEPARRYFHYTIAPGTILRTAVEVEMNGELGLGDKVKPNYQPMRARQILAPPHGLVWRLHAGLLSGSDGATPESSWTRFWLCHLLPIVRASGDDHHRSAFGRVVAEASFWSPASLLPAENVRWEEVDETTARVTVRSGKFEQAVDIKVEPDGRPSMVVIQRWSNENAERRFQPQPFGGYLSAFEEIDGYRLPMQVEGGNWIGTPDYFPFYRVQVVRIRMLDATD